MNVAIISIEGVLAQGEDLRKAAPTKWARPLYLGIRSQFRTMALTRSNDEVARWWLRRESMPDWSGVLSWNQLLSYDLWKVDQVREYLANGWEVAFYLDNDRDAINMVQSLGVLTLGVGAPVHPPGWRADDTQFRPWAAVADTLDPRP